MAALVVSLVPFSPQAVRRSFVYSALNQTWAALLEDLQQVSGPVSSEILNLRGPCATRLAFVSTPSTPWYHYLPLEGSDQQLDVEVLGRRLKSLSCASRHAPRLLIGRRYGASFQKFLTHHLQLASEQEAAADGDGLPSSLGTTPFQCSGVCLTQDQLFLTRALSHQEANVTFYLQLYEGDPFTSPSVVWLPQHTQQLSVGGSHAVLRPLTESESLLEVHMPIFAATESEDDQSSSRATATVNQIQNEQPSKQHLASSSTTTADGAATPPLVAPSTAAFSADLLLPLLPSYFVPLHLLGPRLPQGYTPAHVRQIFGGLMKENVELLTLGRAGGMQTFLRLHEGTRVRDNGVVSFVGEDDEVTDTALSTLPRPCCEAVHFADDYAPYAPDGSLASAFLPLLEATAAMNVEWVPLRELVERAPVWVQDALKPLHQMQTLLYFAQQQHCYAFSSVNGGMVKLAGHHPDGDGSGVRRVGLSRHVSPTPVAVAELVKLIEQCDGAVLVSAMEAASSPLGVREEQQLQEESAAESTAPSMQRMMAKLATKRVALPSLWYDLLDFYGDHEEGGGATSSSHRNLILSDWTKRAILEHYGTLRRCLAFHSGAVFSLRLSTSCEEDREEAMRRGINEGSEVVKVVDEKSPGGGQRRKGSGFGRTATAAGVQVAEEDYVQHIPPSCFLSSSGGTGPFASPSYFLQTPHLMAELWDDYEKRSLGSGAEGSTTGTATAASAAPSTTTRTLEEKLDQAIAVRDRRRAQKIRRSIALRNDPSSPYTDADSLFDAVLRYVPMNRSISLRFLLRHLPSSLTDFFPAHVVNWLLRHEKAGKVQVFEYRRRHHLYLLRPGLPLPHGTLRRSFTEEELICVLMTDLMERHRNTTVRMSTLFGTLPLGVKETVKTKYSTLQGFLLKYPQYFTVVRVTKQDERTSLVRLVAGAQPPQRIHTMAQEEVSTEMSEDEMREEEKHEAAAVSADLQGTLRW